MFPKQVFSPCWFWVFSFCFLSVLTTTWRIFLSKSFTLALRWKRNLYSLHSQERMVIIPRKGFSHWIFIIRNLVLFFTSRQSLAGRSSSLSCLANDTQIYQKQSGSFGRVISPSGHLADKRNTLTADRNLSKREAEDQRLRPGSNWDRPFSILSHGKLIST